MLPKGAVCAVAMFLIALVSCHAWAGIVTYDCGPDADGVMKCSPTPVLSDEGNGVYKLSITGSQYCVEGQGPDGVTGHILGYFTTNGDPTVKMYNSIDNDTAVTWTDYHINISMTVPFTISHAGLDLPTDWTNAQTTQPTPQGNGSYLGTVDYYANPGGTPVAPGGTLDFHYWITFTGNVSYTQEMIPSFVPEPMTLSMIALGGLALLRKRSR
jgi:hypothetical protein